MTISMTPLLRGAGKPGLESTAAAGAATGTPRFAELLSLQAGQDAAGRGQPAPATPSGEAAAEVPAELRDDIPPASGEGDDPALSSEPADKPAPAHDGHQPADTGSEPAAPGAEAKTEPAEAVGQPVVAPALPVGQPGMVEPAAETNVTDRSADSPRATVDTAAAPGKSLPVAAALDETGARPDAAGKVAETATETGDNRSGRSPEGRAPAVPGRGPNIVAGRAQVLSPETRIGLGEREGTAPLAPVDRTDVDIPVKEPDVTGADGEGRSEQTESRGKSIGIPINAPDFLAMAADAEGREGDTGTRANGADIRIRAPDVRVTDERASPLEASGKGDERRVKEAEPRATGAEMAPKAPGGEARLQFKAESDEPVSATPPSLPVVSDDDLPAPGTKAAEAVVSSVQSGGAKTQVHDLSGASEPGTELPSEPKPVSAPPAGEDRRRGAAPALSVGDTPVDVPVRWFREGRAQGQERDAPPTPAARAPATPEWLAQIEHGRRWQQGTEGAGGKPLPPVVEPEVASDEMAEMPADPDATAGKSLAEALLSGRTPVPGQEEGTGPLVPKPATAAVAPSRDGVQGNVPQPERPVTLERTLTLQGGPEHGARQLAQQVQVMVSQNLQEADIRLSPSELGGVRIQLKMEQGEVNIQFLASQPQARELLEQALPRLREMMVQQGMTLGQGQVGGFTGQQGAAQQGAAQQQGSPGHGQQHARQGGDAESLEWDDGEPTGPRRPATGTIDFFA